MESSKEAKKLSPFEEKLNKWVTDHLTFVSFVQKTLFVHHLQIMTKAGLSIVNSLQILSEEIENKKLRSLIADVKNEVETGKQLSEALGKYPKIFPPIYVSMIAAGETSGKLEQSLEQIHDQMKKSQELTSRIRGALIYPAIVLTAMVGIAIEVVVFVLPKLMVMFKEFNAQLPLSTRILIKITEIGQLLFTTYVGPVVLVAGIILWILIKKIYNIPSVTRFMHLVYLRLPIAGPVLIKISLARFTLTLSSLLESAIPIIDAVKITSDVLGNVRYKENLADAADGLKKGLPLSQILAKYRLTFPPMVTEMVMVGEETGQVEHMLSELSEYYSAEVDTTMRNFSTVIEPVIILVLGLAVAGIAVSVIMPMYSLAQQF